MLARRTAVGTLLLIALLAAVAGSALAKSGHQDSPVTAVDAKNGHPLPANPMLHRGERVIVTATGFAAHAQVTVGLVGVQLFGTVTADGDGVVDYTYTLPASIRPGEHALIFSGAARSTAGSARPGNFVVTVPLTEQWPFRTPGRPSGSHGIEGTQGGTGHGTSGHHVSVTGMDVLAALLIAALLLLAGGALVVAARRRTH